MKKFFIFIFVVILLVVGWFLQSKQNESDLKKVNVAEVAHSIFYAPQYVAHALGYFEDEGLDVDITLTAGGVKSCDNFFIKYCFIFILML